MINVVKSYLPSKEKYCEYLEKIYSSAWLTNNGQCVQLLTQKLEAYLGVKNLLLVANATIGLQIAYKALGLQNEVITSPFSFVATTSSLVWEGLTPKFTDIQPCTFCIDENQIESAITSKTSAILPVHVYGNVCGVEKIANIAQQYKLKIIYDAAHAFGVKYCGQSVLNYGDISVLSFHATKLFHTVEGGALIIKDDAVFKRASDMINFGFDRLGSGKIEGLGINAKMSEFHAAMGLCVLEDMGCILAERQKIDRYYREHLPSFLVQLSIHKNAIANYAYFPVIFETEMQLLQAVADLKVQGIIPRQNQSQRRAETYQRLPHRINTCTRRASECPSRYIQARRRGGHIQP